jgi:tRNA (cmo5U34)-methyltransferase
MSHSVSQHLAVSTSDYDAEIRRFVPGYEQALDEALDALSEHLPTHGVRHVLDLGAGTGALSARIAARFPNVRLTLLDADPAMLEQARLRMANALDRASFRTGSFSDPLPSCDAAVASLALHHVHDRSAKRDTYRNILAALPPGGVLLSADAAVPASKALSAPLMERWAAHLVAHGDTREQAFARFEQWAQEDRYFGVDEELDLLREAGFGAAEVRWRLGPITVFVARKS